MDMDNPHFFTGVNETGDACIVGVVDTVDAPVGPLAVRQCLLGTISKKTNHQ
jgi:hypothetical protein